MKHILIPSLLLLLVSGQSVAASLPYKRDAHQTSSKQALNFIAQQSASELLSSKQSTHEEINLIDSVSVTNNIIKIDINPEFRKKYLLDNFFAHYPKEIDLSKLDYSIQIMPCIMNLVSVVWISGRDYYIDSMDEELYYSLEKVKEVIKRMYKKTRWNGRLIPRKLVKNIWPFSSKEPEEKEHMALLFSGGLDSTASSLYHRHKKQLLITVWGHWDLPLHDQHLWKIRKTELREFGAAYGHENVFIKSNYYSFLNRKVLDFISPEISSWRIFVVEGIGWAGLAAPVMLLMGYPILRHASTITWDFNFPAAANPFIDDNIHFAGACVKHDLFDLNRLEKCEYIATTCKKEGLDIPQIRVCEEKIVGNCCKCQKCIRTILELAVIGADPKEYGFTAQPVEQILKKSRSFMAQHATGATTVWHFMHIQNKLQERYNRGEQVSDDLSWILSYNLRKKITSEIKNQKKIDWSEYQDLLPEIEIPKPLKRAF